MKKKSIKSRLSFKVKDLSELAVSKHKHVNGGAALLPSPPLTLCPACGASNVRTCVNLSCPDNYTCTCP